MKIVGCLPFQSIQGSSERGRVVVHIVPNVSAQRKAQVEVLVGEVRGMSKNPVRLRASVNHPILLGNLPVGLVAIRSAPGHVFVDVQIVDHTISVVVNAIIIRSHRKSSVMKRCGIER